MLLCMGMLTGCGSQNTAQETSLLTSNRNAIQNETAIHNGEAIPAPSEKKSFAREEIQSSHPQNPAMPAAPAVFTPDEEELEIGEQEISYGQITVHFPTEITVETEKAENGGTTVHLMDAREWYEYCSSPLPPRIRFLHYKADYEKEEERRILLSALLELIPDSKISIGYSNRHDREYCFQIESGDFIYYALIRDEDLYLIEEIKTEQHYSFSYLLKEIDAVSWKNTGKTIVCDGRFNISGTDFAYTKVTAEDDYRFLCVYDGNNKENRTLTLWLDGYFVTAYQQLAPLGHSPAPENFKDLNFDGYPDIDAGDIYYLWNHEKKIYEAADIPEKEYDCLRPWNIKLFPETKTIWSYDISYVEDSYELAEETEFLWQWEGNRLVRKRECRFTETDEGVQILAVDSKTNHILVDEFISDEKWKESAGRLQAMYESFYDGMAPKEAYGLRHLYQSPQKYIPKELVTEITSSMQNGTEQEYLKGKINDRELAEKEMLSLAGKNMDIRLEVISASSTQMVEADVDNDGKNDILAQSYYGGSGGFTDFILFQGQEDETFQGSHRFHSVMQEFGILGFQGKNYLCRTDFDYNKKIYNGFSISCYVDGKIAETVRLRLIPDTYDIRITEYSEPYRDLAEKTLDQALTYKEYVDNYEIIMGNAEQEPEKGKGYQCDLDNDGKLDTYIKYIWTPSNMGTTDGLIFQIYEEDYDLEQVREAVFSEESPAIMMWADAYHGKNVITVMYRTGLDDFVLAGYLAGKDGYEKVYRITAAVTYGVEERRMSPYNENYRGADLAG